MDSDRQEQITRDNREELSIDSSSDGEEDSSSDGEEDPERFVELYLNLGDPSWWDEEEDQGKTARDNRGSSSDGEEDSSSDGEEGPSSSSDGEEGPSSSSDGEEDPSSDREEDPERFVDPQKLKEVVTAAAEGNLDVLQLLLEEADPLWCDEEEEGKTAFHHAAEHGQIQALQCLLKRHRQLCDMTEEAPKENSSVDIESTDSDRSDIMRSRRPRKDLVNATSKTGLTALLCAAFEGQAETVRFLVDECHADLHIKSLHGSDPVMAAARSGNCSLIRILVDKYGLSPHVARPDRELRPQGRNPFTVTDQVLLACLQFRVGIHC